MRAALKAEGPAGTAIPPSRGSNIPTKENAVNDRSNTTDAAPAASERSWFELANRLEDAIMILRDLSRICLLTAVQNLEELDGERPAFRIPYERGEEIVSLLKASERVAERALAGEQ